jgi:predicted NodU family carbamoyl transferase
MRDGALLAAAQEERFSRRKHDPIRMALGATRGQIAGMVERLDRNGSALNAEVPLHSKLVNVLSGPGEMHTLTAPSQRSARGRLFLV